MKAFYQYVVISMKNMFKIFPDKKLKEERKRNKKNLLFFFNI